MSDTPKTDAAFAEHGKITFQREQYVMADFARELERENAALRADKELVDWIISGDGLEWIYWKREDGKERHVTRENMHIATKGWE